MPLYRHPVVQSLKWKVRIRQCLDLDNDKPPVLRNGEQIDDVAFLANEARDLRVDMPNVYGW